MASALLKEHAQDEETADARPRATQERLSAWALAVSVSLLVAMAAPSLVGLVYVGNDLGAFHLPIRAFYARCLAAGEPFDWMPDLYCGFYLSGEGQAGMYHPLHLLLYRLLPLTVAFNAELLASYPLLLAGTYLFLRRLLGRSDAAMFGSLVFTFSGFNLLHFIHPNAIAVVAHIPWILWAIDILAADSAAGRAAAGGISLLTGSQLLLGYPQYVWFSLLAEGAYSAYAIPSRFPSTRRRAFLARLAVAKGIGGLIGAVQLLPTIDALASSARRAAGPDFANWGSLDPLNLVQLVAPYLFTTRVVGQNTHELSVYLGAVPLVLIAWLFLRWSDLGAWRRPAAASLAFGVLALLLATGEHGGLYYLQCLLPLVGNFRFPCRSIVLVQFSAAILAAISFGLLARQQAQKEKPPWPALAPLGYVVGASLAAALAGLWLRDQPFLASSSAILAGPLGIGSAALLLALAARGVRAAMPGLVILAAIDLGCYGLSYSIYPHTARLESLLAKTPTPPVSSREWDRPSLPESPNGPDGQEAPAPWVRGRVLADTIRVDQSGLHTGNEMTMLGWRRADGYVGLEPARRLDYRRVAALRAAGVEWVKTSAGFEPAGGLVAGNRDWLRVRDPLPRIRLVSAARASQNPAEEIEKIPLASEALTERVVELPGGPPGTVTAVSDRPGRLRLRVDCPARQLLVVAESHHAGWRARVDGQPEPVLRVNGDFLGCVVPAGSHEVVFEFRARSLAFGRILSLAGVGLALAGLIVPRPRSKSIVV